MDNKTPKGWKSFKLKEIATMVKRGISPLYVDENGYIVLNQKCIRNGKLNIEISKKTDILTRIPNEKFLQNGDILINSTGVGTLGRVAVFYNDNNPIKVTVDSHVLIIRLKQTIINPTYLKYNLQKRQNEIELMATGSSGQMELARNMLLNMNIPVPPKIDEQEEIVNVLDAMSEIIRLREECIKHAQDLIPALFQEMFGDPIKNEKKYEKYRIKDLGKVTTGTTPPSSKENMFGGNIPFITPGDLETGNYKYNRYLTEEGSKNSRIVRAGSTMVCCIGATIGKVDRAITDSCFNQQINSIDWNSELINDIYALYLFRLLVPLIKEKASHTTLPILNKGNFENISIPKPDLKFQKQFAQKALEIENYIQEQQEELENANQMFQSILHHAFTGKLTENLTIEVRNE